MADGHRGRIRDRFEEENIDTIPEIYVVERIIHNVAESWHPCIPGRLPPDPEHML